MRIVANDRVGHLDLLIEGGFVVEPNQSVGYGEKVLGEVSGKIREVYVEAVRAQSELHQLQRGDGGAFGFRDDPSGDEHDSSVNELRVYQAKLRVQQTVSDLLIEISKDYPDISKIQAVGLRKGWTLVALPKEGGTSTFFAFGFDTPSITQLFIQA